MLQGMRVLGKQVLLGRLGRRAANQLIRERKI
jgi:hypothetical protein